MRWHDDLHRRYDRLHKTERASFAIGVIGVPLILVAILAPMIGWPLMALVLASRLAYLKGWLS